MTLVRRYRNVCLCVMIILFSRDVVIFNSVSALILPLSHMAALSRKLFLCLSLQNKWLRSLNQAVDQVLGGGGQGSSPGTTAMSRTASYVFTGEGRFKDAQYAGGWLAGRVHGRLERACLFVSLCVCLSHLHLCRY